jgi:hypothetical protein
MPLEMTFAQVWSFRDGLRSRMEMYSDVDQAIRAVGLEAPPPSQAGGTGETPPGAA